MKTNKPWIPLVVMTLVTLFLIGCGGTEPSVDTPTDAPVPATTAPEPTAPPAEPTSPPAEATSAQPEAATATPQQTDEALQSPLDTGAMDSPLASPIPESEFETLRLALLPVLDVLPFHVAEQNGYFEQQGIRVESVPIKSGQERDTLMQTGQVDGMLTDLLSPVLFNQSEAQIKAVRTARRAYPDSAMFYILAAPGSEITSPTDLAGVEVGSAQNTVIEYLTNRLLAAAGLTPDQIVTQEISAIPVRFELLLNGQVPAATLPDPLASGAMAAGAVLVVDDTSAPDLSQSILAFSTEVLEEKPEAIARFLLAWEMAVDELNTNPEAYRDLLIEKGRVPESVQGTFQMPPFPAASVPSPDQLADVVLWALEEGLISDDVPYERMVDDAYLP